MHINKDILFSTVLSCIHNDYTGADRNRLIELCRRTIYNDPTRSCVLKGKREAWKGLPPHKSLFHSPENCGLPIGNLTSQVFAKVYLQHYTKGVKFLGTVIKPGRIYIADRTKGKIYHAIEKQNEIVRDHKPSEEEKHHFLSSMNSYLGIMQHYNTYRLRRRVKGLLPISSRSMFFFRYLSIMVYPFEKSMFRCIWGKKKDKKSSKSSSMTSFQAESCDTGSLPGRRCPVGAMDQVVLQFGNSIPEL